jgi:hypothetical protein
MRVIKLPCFGIKVTLAQKGGAITSDLHEELDEAEITPESENYEAAIDGIESMILAHACAGVDIESPAYVEGIEAAIQEAGNRF